MKLKRTGEIDWYRDLKVYAVNAHNKISECSSDLDGEQVIVLDDKFDEEGNAWLCDENAVSQAIATNESNVDYYLYSIKGFYLVGYVLARDAE